MPSRDDSPDSLPDLVPDPELAGTSAAAPVGRNAKSPSIAKSFFWMSPDFPEGDLKESVQTTLLREDPKNSSARVEEDVIEDVDSDSHSEHPRDRAPPWTQLMLAMSTLCAKFVWPQDGRPLQLHHCCQKLRICIHNMS